MNRLRVFVLIAAPLPIILASLGVTKLVRSEHVAPVENRAISRAPDPNRVLRVALKPLSTDRQQELARQCQTKAATLREQLGEGCELVVHSPFVIAGDMTKQELDAWHAQTIGPASRAMAAAYFRNPPSEPITVLLFGSERSYNHYAKELFGDQGISVYGYYKPDRRTLVMNIDTGGGTLVHELTHALIDFDFPTVPDWFNEGLASLHEHCSIRSDESGVDGGVNWRLPALQTAIQEKKLRSLSEMIADARFRGADVGLNYAQARYFCMYMQEQKVLGDYYRKLRADCEKDPRGAVAVLAVFPGLSWAELDQRYQDWVMTLKRD